MKRTSLLLLLPLLIAGCTVERLRSYAPVESYPDDTWLNQQTVKKALVIVAHDDDAVSCAGTISQLTADGWDVRMFCLYTALPEDSARNAIRRKDVMMAAGYQGIQEVQTHTLNYRRDHGNNPQYYAYFPTSQWFSVFYMDTLRQLIGAFIEQHQPTVIFTLDDVIGGYGHPDHAAVSGIVRAWVEGPNTSVERIYQAVFTPHQAETIMQELPVYQQAKQGCNCAGMPLPNVQVNILSGAVLKQKAMQQYSTEQHNLQKFWPKYDKYPAETYFGIFDREFFHVITDL